MADQEENKKDQTKVESSAEENAAEEGGLSLDELDSAIEAADPHFKDKVSQIGPNEEMQNIAVEGFDIDISNAGEGEWNPPSFLQRIKNKILSSLKTMIGGLKSSISGALQNFKYLSLKKKLAVMTILVLLGLCIVVVYKTFTRGFLPAEKELFIGSLGEWSQKEYIYKPEETEWMFESNHSARNIMVIPKLVVNLKRSPGAGPNPMAALEFYIEGSAADVMVEVKDREAEVKDLFQRNIEEMTFEQISTGEGKQLLCDKLRKAINQILTKGKIRRVYIKTAIVKD